MARDLLRSSAMKYAVFVGALALLVPALAMVAWWSARGKRLVLALLVASPMIGAWGKINFCSFETYRGPDRGFEVTLTDLVAASLCASMVFTPRARLRWLPYNAGPLAAYFACAALSLVATPDALISAFSLFKLVRCAFLYWVVVNAVRTVADRRALIAGWVAAALWMTAIVIYQKYGLGYTRAPGPFDHSNMVPSFLNSALALVLVAALVDDALGPAARALGLAAALGMVFCSISTLSRAGIVLSLGACAAGLAVAAVRVPSRRALGCAAACAVLGIAGLMKASDSLVERFQHAPVESALARVEFNAAAWAMGNERPFGVGINAYSEVLTRDARFRASLVVMSYEPQAGVVHNIYLLALAELGWPGLVAFLIVIGRFVWIALVAAVRAPPAGSALACAAITGMLCVHAAGVLEWVLRSTPVLYEYTVLSAFAVSLAEDSGDP